MRSIIEQQRVQISRNTNAKKKSHLGQFFTPERTAVFMANLFPDSEENCRLLDAGAGIGSLSAAFLNRWKSGGFGFRHVEIDAFELDQTLRPYLLETLEDYKEQGNLAANIYGEDFIRVASEFVSGNLFAKRLKGYTHAILNPPYKKINSKSEHRLLLRHAGIETVNLYSAFVALSVALMIPGGQIVAITPRSFCNGPYYRPFRKFLLKRTALRHIHLFHLRDKAFKDDKVLQENVIIRLEHGGQQDMVTISTSTDDTFTDLVFHEYPIEKIVSPDDSEQFIHIPASPEKNALEQSSTIRCTLAGLGIKVSTGPVVDFRLKAHLRDMPEEDTVPLLYPGHFKVGHATWPIEGMKKSNAIRRNSETEKWLYPTGFYCVVRRFSSKEEKHRIMASVVEPEMFADTPVLGFENHLNVFHNNKRGLPECLARGLAIYLNSSAVDEAFRSFNGHTQVNATDLKLMKYPGRNDLLDIGEWAKAKHQENITQSMIDAKIENLLK